MEKLLKSNKLKVIPSTQKDLISFQYASQQAPHYNNFILFS